MFVNAKDGVGTVFYFVLKIVNKVKCSGLTDGNTRNI